jgi:hypothetical protein
VDYDPIGPAPAGMAGLQVTPDKKTAYTIVANGANGNKRCEFWRFDLASDRLAQKEEVPCRTRFSFGMSSDGKKLYIYGAGFEIEVYDAATLKSGEDLGSPERRSLTRASRTAVVSDFRHSPLINAQYTKPRTSVSGFDTLPMPLSRPRPVV